MDVGKEPREKSYEFLELLFIVKCGVGVRNGAALYHLGEVLGNEIGGHVYMLFGLSFDVFGLKFQGTFYDYEYKCENYRTDNISDHLAYISPFL